MPSQGIPTPKLSQGDKPSSKPFLSQGAIKGRQVRTDKPTTEGNRASKAVVVAEKKSLSQKTTCGKDSFHKTTLSDNKPSGGVAFSQQAYQKKTGARDGHNLNKQLPS
jgi:hypothetical protein